MGEAEEKHRLTNEELAQKYPTISAALAPINRHTEPLVVKTLGVSRFVNMRDFIFAIDNKDKDFMKEHKQGIDNTVYRFYACGVIIPVALFANLKLQKMLPRSFGGGRFHNFVLDFVWYSATFFSMVLLQELQLRDSQFQAVKASMLKQEIPEYLAHMHHNWKQFKIPYAAQVGDRPYTAHQLERLRHMGEQEAKKMKKTQLPPGQFAGNK